MIGSDIYRAQLRKGKVSPSYFDRLVLFDLFVESTWCRKLPPREVSWFLRLIGVYGKSIYSWLMKQQAYLVLP